MVNNNKKGFTLVELSIVLVIVGLLIGGILVGQSLIDSQKINKAVRQITEYDILISNFKSKYKGLPGDVSLLPPGTGNNDGILNSGDARSVWHQLSIGVGLKNKYGENYGIYPNNVSVTDRDCPQFDLEQDTTQGRCLSLTPTAVNITSPIVYRYISGIPFGTAPTRAVLLPKDMLAIDSKIDDGLASNGNVYHVHWVSVGANLCSNGNTYLVDNSFACFMHIRMGSTNGDFGRR